MSVAPGTRVLLVEDNQDIRLLFSTALTVHGFEVLTAAGGRRTDHPITRSRTGSPRR
jgi:DNA-binding response OmpR family regulator